MPNPATKVTQLCCDNYKKALSLLFFAGFAVLSKLPTDPARKLTRLAVITFWIMLSLFLFAGFAVKDAKYMANPARKKSPPLQAVVFEIQNRL